MRQLNIKAASIFSSSLTRRAASCAREMDFFGITDVTSKDIAGCFSDPNQLSLEERSKKYEALRQQRHKLANEQVLKDLVFGKIRVDAANVPQTHGQYEPTSTKLAHSSSDIKTMYGGDVPNEQAQANNNGYAKVKLAPGSRSTGAEPDEANLNADQPPTLGNPAYKISEVKPVRQLSEIIQIFKVDSPLETSARYSNKPPLKFEFDADPDDVLNVTGVYARARQHQTSYYHRIAIAEEGQPEGVDKQDENEKHEPKADIEYRPQFMDDLEAKHGDGQQMTQNELDSMIQECNDELSQAFEDDRFDPAIDAQYAPDNSPIKKQSSAMDYLREVQSNRVEPVSHKLKTRLKETERPYPLKPSVKLDSKGQRIYTHQVPDWSLIRHSDILEHVKSSIVYNNYDILAINKPYGIASHDEERERESIDMNSLVRELAKSLNIERVYLAHRLDKLTTGLLLFATSQEMANKLNKLFKSDSIKKSYWCITKGVPDPEEAIIDIPIATFETAGKTRSVPAPEDVPAEYQLSKNYKAARRAVTEYRVLSSNNGTALVEVKPRSGVKHQIRAHLSFGINTPILGDHKYSHFGSLKPQKLGPKTLKCLNLRQEKVRTLPMHLHSKTIVIPGAKANGETLFIHAPLPHHFVENARSLKLRLSSG